MMKIYQIVLFTLWLFKSNLMHGGHFYRSKFFQSTIVRLLLNTEGELYISLLIQFGDFCWTKAVATRASMFETSKDTIHGAVSV